MNKDYIKIYEMYDKSSGTFNKPSQEQGKIYYGPDGNSELTEVNDWSTWVCALAHWLSEKLGFVVSMGPGTSFGKIGRMDNSSVVYQYTDNPLYYVTSTLNYYETVYWLNGVFYNKLPDNPYIQCDNDWTNSNYGLIDMSNEEENNPWEVYRAPSPFKPDQIDIINSDTNEIETINCYTDGTEENGKLKWTGKWGNESDCINQGSFLNAFDIQNNRFDINFSNSNFNNLGFRIKYPLTTTTTRCIKPYRYYTSRDNEAYNVQHTNSKERYADVTSYIGIMPCSILINNNKLLLTIYKTKRKLSNFSYKKNISPLIKNLNEAYLFLPQSFINFGVGPSGTKYRLYIDSASAIAIKNNDIYVTRNNETLQKPDGYNSRYVSSITSDDIKAFSSEDLTIPKGWTKKTLQEIVYKEYLFDGTGRQFNKIYCLKSLNNNILYITLINDENNKKSTEYLFYKCKDGDNIFSGCLMSEEKTQTRNSSESWNIVDETLDLNQSRPYGNIAGISINSRDPETDKTYELTPNKYYKDVRDNTQALIDSTGSWRLEQFVPVDSEVPAMELYLVTRCGTADPIPAEGKYILCNINNDIIKFLVFSFNNSCLGELKEEFNKSYTLFAIPIEIVSKNNE